MTNEPRGEESFFSECSESIFGVRQGIGAIFEFAVGVVIVVIE